jgi:hypothetical protein
VIGVALDKDAGTVTFYKNNASQGAISLPTNVPMVAWISPGAGSSSATANFGQRPFAYTAPSGFKALCTTNLPTPAIGATSTTQAGDYFNTVLYTGNNTVRQITGVGFSPDFTWIKRRNPSDDHYLFDSVRGATKYLSSNTTASETTNTFSLTSFDADGVSLGISNTVNSNTNPFVAWNWKANGSGSTNTAGSITSTVSANTTSGFSIVTYTGTSVAATIGHGLGVAPQMIIVKSRTGTPDVPSWRVYHVSTGATQYLELNSTGAATTYGDWNNTAPTSTVFSVGAPTFTPNNQNGINYVAYCCAQVAGYSAFGSYTGNGSADGPMVFTGFRPAYVMIKQSSASGEHWVLLDNKRNTENVVNKELYANLANAEGSNAGNATLDFLSNGFKIRTSNAGQNTNGATYIYAAFAESPFKYALAR